MYNVYKSCCSISYLIILLCVIESGPSIDFAINAYTQTHIVLLYLGEREHIAINVVTFYYTCRYIYTYSRRGSRRYRRGHSMYNVIWLKLMMMNGSQNITKSKDTHL